MKNQGLKKESLNDRKIVIFDVKTSEEGINSTLMYFAARTYVNNEMVSKDNFFINTNQDIPEYIQRKYRITKNKLNSEGVPFSEALERIANIFSDGILFTYNGDAFTFQLIEKIFTQNGYSLDLSTIDALKLAKAIIGFESELSLSELSSKLGIVYNEDKMLSAPYCAILLEKIWFRLKSFIISV